MYLIITSLKRDFAFLLTPELRKILWNALCICCGKGNSLVQNFFLYKFGHSLTLCARTRLCVTEEEIRLISSSCVCNFIYKLKSLKNPFSRWRILCLLSAFEFLVELTALLISLLNACPRLGCGEVCRWMVQWKLCDNCLKMQVALSSWFQLSGGPS